MPKAESKRSEKGKAMRLAYGRVFESEDGKKILIDLMDVTGYLGSSIDHNNPNAITMAFNDGAKSILSRIISTINMPPEEFLSMVEQKQQEEYDYVQD